MIHTFIFMGKTYLYIHNKFHYGSLFEFSILNCQIRITVLYYTVVQLYLQYIYDSEYLLCLLKAGWVFNLFEILWDTPRSLEKSAVNYIHPLIVSFRTDPDIFGYNFQKYSLRLFLSKLLSKLSKTERDPFFYLNWTNTLAVLIFYYDS